MGRDSTGAITTGSCLQVWCSSFVEHIKKGATYLTGSIEYPSGSSIGVKLLKESGNYWAKLSYQKTIGGEKRDYNYRVPIVSLPSNLGKGELYYFLCPVSGRRCKVLYMGYGSEYFKCREAYRLRIYYASQLSSRLDKHNDTYWRYEKKIKQEKKKHPKTHYRGKQTEAAFRIMRMEQKRFYHDQMRWRLLPVALMKSLARTGGKIEDWC